MKTLLTVSTFSFGFLLTACGTKNSPPNASDLDRVQENQTEHCQPLKDAEASLQKTLNDYEKGVFYAYYCK